MTACAEYHTNKFTLVFSGTTLGDHVHTYQSKPVRVSEIDAKHNFWASSAILDGSYPALVWEHQFSLYKSATNEVEFVRFFVNLATHVNSRPLPLELKYETQTVVAFGSCYLDVSEHEEPDSLLHTAAGLVSLRFRGTSLPSVSTIT